MKFIRKFFFRLIPRYRYLERDSFAYAAADRLIRQSEGKPESDQWQLDTKMEDRNRAVGLVVYLCRRQRIWE